MGDKVWIGLCLEGGAVARGEEVNTGTGPGWEIYGIGCSCALVGRKILYQLHIHIHMHRQTVYQLP